MMTDIERIIENEQRRLDELSRPEIWERYTKNMESGELRDFTQSYRDSQAIVKALRRTAEYDKAESEGRVEILTPSQKEARDRLANYSAEDRFIDEEYK